MYCEFCKFNHEKIHADFNFVRNYDVILIIDLNKGNRSVTNDIEYVLWSIKEYYKTLPFDKNFTIAKFKIIYRDSTGIWDGIKLDKEGNFKSFYSLNKIPITDINLALAKVSKGAVPLLKSDWSDLYF
jgi:hypothetical protein